MRRRIVVSGRVQGVFFRASTREQAEARGLAGWVRNRPDGSVEAELEGPAADVDAVVGWMRRGPAQARVASVEVSEVDPEGVSGFSVR